MTEKPATTDSPLLTPVIWQDPDVRWLTGTHEAEGRSYFIQEGYEELLWWLQLPALCSMAQSAVCAKPEAEALRKAASAIAALIADATAEAARAGYCLEDLLPEEAANVATKPAGKDRVIATKDELGSFVSVDTEAKGRKS